MQLIHREFIDCCLSRFEDMATRGMRPRPDAVADAVNHSPAPRFYFEFDTALPHVRRLMAGDRERHTDAMPRTARRAAYADLCGCVRQYRLLHPVAPLTEALSYVLNFRRPRGFYLSDDSARRLFRAALRMRHPQYFNNCTGSLQP